VSLGADEAAARIDQMTCTCRGADAPHEHYFVESTILRGLTEGAEVDLSLEPRTKTLLVTGAS
jgi:hypothetical protein